MKIITSVCQTIGWNDTESKFLNYLREQEEGKRVALIALSNGEFAGCGNIIWASSYIPFREKGIPEISDLNALPQFRLRGVATAILDQAEALLRNYLIRQGLVSGFMLIMGRSANVCAQRVRS